MKRLFIRLLFIVLLLSAAPLAQAGDGGDQAAKKSIGIFTDDDGSRILVGVGTTNPLVTLDVSKGEVKIGSTGTPCRGALAGTLRFAHARLQVCDGTGWRNVSLDKIE